jgi:two-component system, cell cycle response regulator DivK
MNAKRILLVNGDEHTRYTYRVLLQLNGFSVQEAGDGVKALEAVRLQPPDLIVQELRLGALEGLELIRTVKRTEATRHIWILVISSQALDGEKATEAGCDGFLAKPCRPSQMMEAAQRMLA